MPVALSSQPISNGPTRWNDNFLLGVSSSKYPRCSRKYALSLISSSNDLCLLLYCSFALAFAKSIASVASCLNNACWSFFAMCLHSLLVSSPSPLCVVWPYKILFGNIPVVVTSEYISPACSAGKHSCHAAFGLLVIRYQRAIPTV